MAGFPNPFKTTGLDQLEGIIGDVGGRAQGLLKKKVPGTKTLQQTVDTLEKAPPTLMAGGGTLESGGDDVLQRILASDIPSYNLPLYQAEQGRRAALANILGGAGALGGVYDLLGAHMGITTERNLQELANKLGLYPNAAAGVGGAGGLLLALLGGV